MERMTDRDWTELYGRLDERLKNIEAQVTQFNAQRQCATNSEKIRTLEKIVWSAMAAAGTALIKAFWPGAH